MNLGTVSYDVRLCAGAVDVASLVDLTPWPADCGAQDIFVGRTRGEIHPVHGPLRYLEYEVYAPMAHKLMQTMAENVAAQFDVRAVRLVHAQGPVNLGQASVVIVVATPHRSESFAACRALIDRVKHELPIWKREIWERGETFVEGCCVSHATPRRESLGAPKAHFHHG